MDFDELEEEVQHLHRTSWEEGLHLEFKSARGGVPKEMWPTYSAFANTQGGIILLGVEDDGRVSGVENPGKYIDEIVNQLNNPQKCSINLCEGDAIKAITLQGKQVLAIYVPMASPVQRPVFIRGKEENSYIRHYSADARCKKEDLLRMRRNRDIAESPAHSQDSVIIRHTSLEDLDKTTIQKFRYRMQGTQMGAMWQGLADLPLLRKLGAYRKDRETGEEGLTLAGLLMFGNSDALNELRPSYHVDYFEYEETIDVNARWSDRITNDGTWSGNLFDFFYSVLPLLLKGLKRPFLLGADMNRRDETAAHTAVREALANALIHADYAEQFGICIEHSPQGLLFSNPGSLLVPREVLFAEQAHISICRNKLLQRMFQTLGVAEHAGSGIDKIVNGWFDSCIAIPSLEEYQQPDRVVWRLPFVGMISQEKMAAVSHVVGVERFSELDKFDKLILLCIASGEAIRHADISPSLPLHAADISKRLARLVARGFLKSEGRARGMKYSLAHQTPTSQNGEMSKLPEEMSKPGGEMSKLPEEMSKLGEEMSKLGGEMSKLPEEMSKLGGEMSKLPEEMSKLGEEMSKLMSEETYPAKILAIRNRNWTSKRDMQDAIVTLCADNWRSIISLATILQRDPRTIARHCLELIKQGLVEAKYPDSLRHPQQAYRAATHENLRRSE